MVRRLMLATALVCAALIAPRPVGARLAPEGQDHRPGAVLVGFRSGATAAEGGALVAAGYQVTREFPELNMVAVGAPAGQEEATRDDIARLPGVAFAELDYWLRPQAAGEFYPNDPGYAGQWALPLIGAPEAWSVSAGAPEVVIAVIDSGLDLTHPDLAAQLWINAGEIPANGEDDDGNGKVDDVNGWHFYQECGESGCESRENGAVADDSGHGSHVGGIAAATTNNGEGVAGIASASRIMAVKVIDMATGVAAHSDVAAGILYAVNNGASIINVSLGGAQYSQTLCAAVSAAVSRGKLVVAAAGNLGQTVYYPAACPGALAVGATDSNDNPANFTNPGTRVDLAAPGVDILSVVYPSTTEGSAYATRSGTSQATPHVAAAAALVWARWPELSADDVKAQLLGSVKDVGPAGRDDKTGWGRLDLARAVREPVRPVDLRLLADVQPPQVIAGNPLTATFTVVNRGEAAASSVTLNAILPTEPVYEGVRVLGSGCSLGGHNLQCGTAQLDAGASVSVTVVMTPTAAGVGRISTTASVSAAQRELTPSDNRQAASTRIRPVLSGRIYLDGNGDGAHQPWETRGVPGAYILLKKAGQTVLFAPVETPTGRFQLDMLPSGQYTLLAVLPEGYEQTTPDPLFLEVLADREQSAFIGAWTGVPESISGRLNLPLLLNGQ